MSLEVETMVHAVPRVVQGFSLVLDKTLPQGDKRNANVFTEPNGGDLALPDQLVDACFRQV